MVDKRITIIIPNYNGRHHLDKNLVQLTNLYPKIQIIIVDDVSTDDSVSYIKNNFPQVKLILNKQNIGFARSINKGVKKAKSKYVLLLNNDVGATKGFLEPLLVKIQEDNVFAVGCQEISIKKGKEVKSGKSWLKVQKGLPVHGRSKNQISGNTAWCQGGSMLVKKNLFIKLGGFDPIYAPGYWEDIDLGYRAEKEGYINWFCQKSIVYHNHGSTFGSIYSQNKITLLSYRNMFLFCWKNFNREQMAAHLAWLPYNIIVNSIKTKGVFAKSFVSAIKAYKNYSNE
jgi:GT2 family glycosyltransferase